MSLLRAPTESESNALLHELFGSRFIYSSLVHAVSGSERGLVLSPYARGSATATGQQLMVRTASFVHTGVLNHFKQRASTTSDTPPNSAASLASQSSTSPPPQASGAKNEQLCYIEFLTPTQEGFAMVFCSLDASDISAGKAPSERVIALHPMSGWLTVQPKPDSPEMLEITFQAAFPGNAPGGCDARVAQNRLLFIAKGVCRLDKVLRRRRRYRLQQRTTSGRLWQALLKPFRVLGVTDDDTSGGARHNWHCIACTRSLLPTLNKRWRRCDLCAYRVCADPPCCSQERVAIYSRCVAPLLVCARCRECIDERESPPRSSGYPVGGARGEARYAGVCLRFTDQEMDLEPEMERDPSIRSHDRSIRVGATHSTGTRRSSEGIRTKRRTQSDPPPILGLALSSSGDDNSFSGTDLDPGPWSK
ncbi:unnamed protein product [Phytophthora lilii]|uniref:Unnamed protein product n=1 Tax=Phytophthora lilii TaxID=2077276 RepID=A0A9W6TH85_9STRA|nr:unnamed protein product [Phytophthora lilii]